MTFDNYIKTILSGLKTWAQATFAKKSDIKDMYYSEISITTLVDNLTSEDYYNGDYDYRCNFTPGEKYNVIWNGTLYENVVCVYENGYNILGSLSLNYPFYIDDDGGNSLYVQPRGEDDEFIVVSIIGKKEIVHQINPKYIPLATNSTPGAVRPIVNNEYGMEVWMHPETGELFYGLPMATNDNLGGVRPINKTNEMTMSVGVDNEGRLYAPAGGVGQSTEGEKYVYEDEIVTAAEGAEIFNDYSINKAAGKYSHAEGTSSAIGEYSHSEGFYTKAQGNYSHAEGGNTKAEGTYSHAEGCMTKAIGVYSHAEGDVTIASGQASHAEGMQTHASGGRAHAEGSNTSASGYDSHAEGRHTAAGGLCSHAEGEDTIASANFSHAEGYSTKAYGTFCSHAEGYYTQASGDYSHVEGYYTSANSPYQHVQGKYNISDAEEIYAHIVGNGDSSAPSNAHTLDWDGNAWYAGTVECTGIIMKSSTSGSTKKFKITVDDSGTLTATAI